jgi:mRNA interferase HigB
LVTYIVRIISKAAIREFSEQHEDALEPLMYWYRVTKRAQWANLAAVRVDFRHADLVDKYTVFNIGGNKYRLIVSIKYRWHVVYVRRILTHSDYEREKWK